MRITEIITEAANLKKQAAIAIAKKKKKGVAEGLNEFAQGSGGGESGRWYTDDEMTDIVGDGWWQDMDVSGANIGVIDSEVPKEYMIQQAQAWLDDQGYSVQVLNCKVNDDDMEWYIEGSFQNSSFAKKGLAEGLNEFALPGGDDREPDEEEILRQLASQWWLGTEQQMAKAQNTLAAMGWEIGQDESGDDDAGVFVIRAGDENGNSYMAFPHSELQGMNEGENWSKHNNKRAGGMSKKSVSVYRREHPGSKIQTAVTTKPSKLKKGSKSAKRRASFCARMRGMKKHRTSAKTAHDPNSNINKSLRRWHCESIEELHELVMIAEQFIHKRKNEGI
jgi:hypothetical protein